MSADTKREKQAATHSFDERPVRRLTRRDKSTTKSHIRRGAMAVFPRRENFKETYKTGSNPLCTSRIFYRTTSIIRVIWQPRITILYYVVFYSA